jgi:hypothetical protein
MTTQSDFSADDWMSITSAPIIAAAVISASDDVGEDRESEDEEIAAFKSALEKLEKKYAKCDLVSDVLRSIKSEGTEEFEVLFATLGSAASHESPLEDRVKAVAQAGEKVDLIADKKEAKLYKKFIMDAATAVASASKEGFFVFGSPISKKEEFYLRQIQSALGI